MRGIRLVVVAFVVASAATVATAAASVERPSDALDFRKTFDHPAAGGSLTYTATYRTGSGGSTGTDGRGDATHHVAVWRDGDRRIKRRTDEAIESYVVRPAGADEWSMTVLDLKRRIRTDVDRTNLMRIGYAENWFAQTHALAMPRGTYRLTALKTAATAEAPAAPCRWYRLDQPQRTSSICWSPTAAIPMMIVDGSGTTVWRVDHLSVRPIAKTVFDVTDTGFVRNDANADIQPD